MAGTIRAPQPDRVIRCFDCDGRGRQGRRRCATCLGSGRLWETRHEEEPPAAGDAAVIVIEARCEHCGVVPHLQPDRRAHKAVLFRREVVCGQCKTGRMAFVTEPVSCK